MAPGELLLPSRELAQLVGVSRSTIQMVYEELFSRGYTVTSRRSGTRVSDWAYAPHSSAEASSHQPGTPELPKINMDVSHLYNWIRGNEEQVAEIDFSPHEPYLDDQFKSIGANLLYRRPPKQTWTIGHTVTPMD